MNFRITHHWLTKIFRLDYNPAVSDEVLEEITNNLPNLHLLTLAHAGSDATISEEVVMKIGKLKELQIVRLKFKYYKN